MSPPKLRPTPPKAALMTAQQMAYSYIRSRILDGTYAGGLWLKAADIADELKMSRMPVRDALRQLDAEGLVTLRPNRGALVTELSPEDISDLFAMSAVLVALAGSLALPALTDRALADLELMGQAMDQARGDVNEWMARHDAFHDYLAGLCGRRFLVSELSRLRTVVHPYLRMYFDVNRDTDLPEYEHHALIAALRTRNSVLIERTLREHVLSAARGFEEFVRYHGRDEKALPPKADGTEAA
jgi:DNA-binding GntR family transcriptional regulator